MTAQKRIGHIGIFLFLLLFLGMILFPLLIVGMNSVKNQEDFTQHGPFAWPTKIVWGQIQEAAQQIGVFNRLWTSFLISIPTAILASLLSLMNGYALGIGRIRGKVLFLIFFMVATTLPQESLVYPLYYIFRQLKLYNSHLGVILPLTALHLSFGTYLLASVMATFPRDFVDAAEIDGAGKLYVLLHIVLPLAMPTISVLFVFFFIWSWNDFFISLIFLISEKIQTLPLGVLQMRGQYVTNINLQSAAALILSFPCIVFFLLFQRTLTKGVMASGLKG
jgi:raffinose/stachyose/melibiose transport system permease protein